jgi:hypothetical protein
MKNTALNTSFAGDPSDRFHVQWMNCEPAPQQKRFATKSLSFVA